MPAMVTSSPMLHATHPHSHSPLNLSPAGSPALRPTNPSKSHKSSPITTPGSATPLGPFPNPLPVPSSRSYVRQPTQRPYQSALVSRASAGGGRAVREVEGDSLRFAELVAGIVWARGAGLRKGGNGLGLSLDEHQSEAKDGMRASKSLAGSVGGSWEIERAELIVDVPVWSPGCFQDLSTLHALRDTTLSHTHSLLAHLISKHGIPASYRLLARSAVTRGRANRVSSGWGCIRLAPTAIAPPAGRSVLKPKIRRSSMDIKDCRANAESHGEEMDRPVRSSIIKSLNVPVGKSRYAKAVADVRAASKSPIPAGGKTPEMGLEEVIADDDEEDTDVQLKMGYRSSSVSDDEDEEDADTLVAREVERRGAKEGSAFLMTLFGGPALILV